MKVTIDKSGKLTITAETQLEDFALMKWYDDYFNQKTAVLAVQTTDQSQFENGFMGDE